MNMSLRLRLILIILVPLLVIAGAISIWAVFDAQQRASDRFDRSLLSAALAVSRDVAVSGGDALSPDTNALLRDTSGGKVFYHVYAPDGVFVTGYATPPVPASQNPPITLGQQYFEGKYQGQSVRVLRFIDAMQIEGVSGDFTVTVWQSTQLRGTIVRDLSWRTFQILASLMIAVALVVWFGVRFGLRPLLDLERAIARRSSDELTPIRRKVPIEAQGIVRTLNGLLGQVSSSMQAKDVFISNAAHQLRNPIAGVLAMSEAVQSARTFDDMRQRTRELVLASRRASSLANKLLALERAKSKGVDFKPVSIAALFDHLAKTYQPPSDIDITTIFEPVPPDLEVLGDETMLFEAITNLIDNVHLHAGNTLSKIVISASERVGDVSISIQDDGKGMDPSNIERAKERFVQIEPSEGSGLGLAIAQATAQHHGGDLTVSPQPKGLIVAINIPISR